MRLGYKERQRRQSAEGREVWDAAEQGLEPSLREYYAEIPRAPIRIIGCAMAKAVNHGGILRSAEAFRIEHVSLEQEPDAATDFSGHRGALKWQPYNWQTPIEAVVKAKADGYTIYALTLEQDAISIDKVDWQFPCAIVLGSEKSGIPAEVLAQTDQTIAIPMYGAITSLNVATAAAICLHSAVGAYHRANPEFVPIRPESAALLKD